VEGVATTALPSDLRNRLLLDSTHNDGEMIPSGLSPPHDPAVTVPLTYRPVLLLNAALSFTLSSGFATGAEECPSRHPIAPHKQLAPSTVAADADESDRFVEQHVASAVVFCTPQQDGAKATSPTVKAEAQPESEGYTGVVRAIAVLLDSLAKILASIAWPIAAVVVAYYFKKEIASLLGRLKRFKAGNSEAEFGELLREAESTADPAIKPDAAEEPIKPADAEEAAIHPRGSVISAWIKVENALFKLYKAFAPAMADSKWTKKSMRPNDVVMLRELVNIGVLPSSLNQTYMTLRLMRAKAAHEEDFEASPEDVVGFTNFAQQLVATFDEAGRRT